VGCATGERRRLAGIRPRLSGLVALLGACGCGNAPAGPADGGDVPPDRQDVPADGADVSPDYEDVPPENGDVSPDSPDVPADHVLFVLSFRKAPPRPVGVDLLQTAYLQEYDIQRLDSTGVWDAATYRDWLGLVEPVRSGFASKAYQCMCDQCGACRNPTEADGTLVSTPQVVELRDAEEIAYEWDGTFWIRSTCLDGTECVSVAEATAGRYAVEFSWGFTCWEGPPDRTCHRINAPYGSSGPIYFDYPGTSTVRYTIDCSAETNYTDPGEPCI
jgi:hypothetical protein